MSDWGQSLAHVNELRREIKQLRQTNARLQTDRSELRAALARGADSREARRLPVQSIEAVSGGISGTAGPSSPSPDA